MKTKSIFLLLTLAFSLFACNEEYPELEDGMYAEFNTSLGPIVAELYFEETPMTVASFVSLAEGTSTMVDSTYKDKKYYDGLIFHRVIDGFMIQGGDPTGTGSGGPGYKYPDEFVDSLSHDAKGVLSMANAGPGTNGSQFFITLAPVQQLDGRHTVFGKIVKGQDVVDSIGKVETGPRDRPVTDVVMKEVNIIRKGKAAKNFDASKSFEGQLAEIEAKKEAESKKMQEIADEKVKEFQKFESEADSLDSGLKIYFLNKGDGEKPKNGQTVNVNYEGYFANGTIFDTNKMELAKELGIYDHRRESSGGYNPMPTVYGPDAPMIPGFKEGIQQMSIGDEALVWVPSHLGYGERGAGGVIPPNTDLIFKIELVKMDEEASK
ncbi:peptidylprolyl isomerase [Christiangramia sabulilitoris]|uniref:peptidylprolyl isomerase n=1 Tax=Christiangramia sabulilitoris TaxID=2583991 RepID=A0A550I7E2_9FLAO|nr:peptidylprolyl isomerase [Christiangramia sabulilitoris]TRO66887.1 peptidylprolyl isomerase [Christiangramia sabulilitoris]